MPIRPPGSNRGRARSGGLGGLRRGRRLRDGVGALAGVALGCALAGLAGGGLSGCAALPALGMTLAAQATQTLVVAGLGGIDAARESMDKDRCNRAAAKGVSVTETLESAMPAHEGDLQEFGPLAWRTAFAHEGYPSVDTARRAVEVRLALTRRSVTFVGAARSTSVRIPLELVEEVEVRGDAASRMPEVMVLRSCAGRFDIVALGATRDPSRDAESTAAMADKVKAAMALAQESGGR